MLEIKKSKNFGSDSQFHKLKKEIDDANFLTQFNLKIDTPTGIPNQQAFAIVYFFINKFNHFIKDGS